MLAIDFGTSNTCGAVMLPEWLLGRPLGAISPELIRDSEKNELFPSCVFISDTESLVGHHARARLRSQPECYLDDLKRLVSIKTTPRIGEKSFHPEELIARVLSHVQVCARDQFGDRGLESMVLTVPATYTSRERDVMKNAAEIAGMPSPAFLEEPVAAAVYYASMNELSLDPGQLALVYDFGGGTFDATVIEKTKHGFYRIPALPRGLAECGGTDIDATIFDLVLASESARTRDEISNGKGRPAQRKQLELREICRSELKHPFSDLKRRSVMDVPLPRGLEQDSFSLNRADFERIVEKFVAQTIICCSQALDELERGRERLSTILLVGGSSRLTLAVESLKSTFGNASGGLRILRGSQPDVVVALGAAIWGMQVQAPDRWPVKVVTGSRGQDQLPCSLVVYRGQPVRSVCAGVTSGLAHIIYPNQLVEVSLDVAQVTRHVELPESECSRYDPVSGALGLGREGGFEIFYPNLGNQSTFLRSPGSRITCLSSGGLSPSFLCGHDSGEIFRYLLHERRFDLISPPTGIPLLSIVSAGTSNFVTHSQNGEAKLWARRAGGEYYTVVLALRAHAVAIAGGGNVCAVVDPYNRVRVFDISERSASETETKQFPGLMSDHITVIALTTDGEGIAVGTAKGKVIVSINGSFTKLAGQSGAVSVLSWIGNDQWLLATDDDGSIRWLDFLSGKPGTICPTFSPVRSVAVNADGTNIVAVADLPIRNTALLLKTGLGAPLRLACEEPVISAAAFSADEAHVVVCAQAMHFFSAESGVVSPSIYEADRTLSSLKMFEFLAKNAIQLAISPSGEYIALATQEGHVKLWQRSPLCSFGILGRGVVGSKKLVFTSDERYLVAATPKTVYWWDLQADNPLASEKQQSHPGRGLIADIATKQGSHVLVVCDSHSLRLFDLDGGGEIAVNEQLGLGCVAFLNESIVGVQNREIVYVSETDLSEQRRKATGHIGQIQALAVARVCGTLVTASSDGAVRIESQAEGSPAVFWRSLRSGGAFLEVETEEAVIGHRSDLFRSPQICFWSAGQDASTVLVRSSGQLLPLEEFTDKSSNDAILRALAGQKINSSIDL